MVDNLGDLICKLREINNITQEELAQSINCSRSYISYLERNQRNLQPEYCTPLSRALNFNFKVYLRNYHKYNSINHYILTNKIIDLLNESNYDKAQFVLENDNNINELSYGAAYIIKVYSTTLIKVVNNQDYISAEKDILNLLKINSRNKIAEFTPDFSDEERYYSSIILLSNILASQGEYKYVVSLLSNTIDFLEKHLFDEIYSKETIDLYYRKLYITAYNNYADAFFNLGEYSEALKYCNITCELIVKYELNHIWELVLKLKIEVLCSMNKFDEAQMVYDDFKVICKLKGMTDYFNFFNEIVNSSYPQITTSTIM